MVFNSGDYVKAKTILSQYGRCPQENVNMAEYVRFVDIEGAAAYEWSQWSAQKEVNISGNKIVNVSGIQFSDGTYIGHGSSFDISSTQAIKINTPSFTLTGANVKINGGTPYTTANLPPDAAGGATWSQFAALMDVSFGGHSIVDLSMINGGTPYTTAVPPPHPSTWSSYAATQSVSLSGHSITNVNDISAVTVNRGTPYTTVNQQPALMTAGFAHSRTLYVDGSYGNDAAALGEGRYSHPFKTIDAAATAAVAGDTVLVFPGTYTLSGPITIKDNTSIRGASVQTTAIQYTATTNTILITAGASSRIEDLTIDLSSITSNLTLIGVDFSGTSTTSKLRTSVVNVSTTDTSSTVIGVRSSGTTSTLYASSDAVRSSTINVYGHEDSIIRGVYCTGANRISLRDVNIYASDSSTNAIGVEVMNPSGVIYLRSCSCYGTRADISQPVGKIWLGSTDLVNSNANGYDFTTLFSPVNAIYGMYGKNPTISEGTYYLYPGVWSDDYLTISGAGFITPSQICIHDMSVLIRREIPSGASIIVTLQRNMIDISGMKVTISQNSTQGTYNIDNGSNKSQQYLKGDKITIKLVVSGAIIPSLVAPLIDLSVY